MPSAIILMADYGNDPTEVATPFSVFKDAGFDVSFATENGAVPKCDTRMLEGMTGKLLGAAKPALAHHATLLASPELKSPLSWSSPDFTLAGKDLVFLPGGHDKGMRQYITSPSLHAHLAAYVPSARRPSRRTVAAICHGVQVLAETTVGAGAGEKSVLHDIETTALPGTMEMGIWYATRVFLGDYYRTFGGAADSVEAAVRKRLDDEGMQWKCSLGSTPFVHEDPNYNYISARFPPDAELLGQKAVEMVKRVTQS